MANQLDLEEQEQLDQIKHFWKQYGNLITWVLALVMACVAGWNGYQYWQRNQATQAAAMFDEVERMAQLADMAKVDRAFGDMKERFATTTYAQHSGLLAARLYAEAGKAEQAKAALLWVSENASDPGLQAIARLRLAGLLMQSKDYAQALAQLDGKFPPDFSALVADRRGDIHSLQGKTADAKAEYQKAYAAFDERTEYRRLVEIKLNALGSDPRPAASAPAAPSSSAVTP